MLLVAVSVVIDNFDISCIAAIPDETQSKLVIDANAVLSRAITRQCFQPVSRRRTQKFKRHRAVKLLQFSLSNRIDIGEPFGAFTFKQSLCLFTSERFDHCEIVYRLSVNDNRHEI